jgi:hypothetical protein
MAEVTTLGIENLKAGIATTIMLICEGIKLAKKASVIIAESKDLQLDEGLMLIIDAATVQAPKIMEALKA